MVRILTMACGALAEVTCDAQNYQWCVDFTGDPNTEGRGAPEWDAVAGTTYYIRISSDASLADPQTGDLAIMLDTFRDPRGSDDREWSRTSAVQRGNPAQCRSVVPAER